MNVPYPPTDDASLTLLAEVRDYLLRLPVVPTTRALARRIDDHLEMLRRPPLDSAGTASNEPAWVGTVQGDSGVPVLHARLQGRQLRLTPSNTSGLVGEQRLLSALSGGVTIKLNQAGS